MERKSISDAFYTVARALVKQNVRSMDEPEEFCMYRGPGGMKCAIGHLIADEYYRPKFEGNGVKHDLIEKALMKSGWPVDGQSLMVYSMVQEIHDDFEPEEWENELEEIRDYLTEDNVIERRKFDWE